MFNGIRFHERSNTWLAQIIIDGQNIYLGNFETKELAAEEFNRLAKRYFGDLFQLHIPKVS